MNINGYKISPRANLCGANLYNANLYDADLYNANLYNADLSCADLSCAHLRGANLYNADLSCANLYGADLRGANLYGANLYGADLSCADLRGANLYGANLSCADLEACKLPDFQIPQEGALTVYKKLKGSIIAKLIVPNDARRTATPTGRKCRAEYVDVVELYGAERGTDMHSETVTYVPGARVYPDAYDDDIRVECTNGIHFFLTRAEAERY